MEVSEDDLEQAVSKGFESIVLSAQRNNRVAQQFLSDCRNYYLSGQELPPEELCFRTSEQLRAVLHEDPACLAQRKASTTVCILAGAAIPVVAFLANPLYAIGPAAVAIGAYIARNHQGKKARAKARTLRQLLTSQPSILAEPIAALRGNIGYALWNYGALNYEELRSHGEQASKA
jgi:hypothetical protein